MSSAKTSSAHKAPAKLSSRLLDMKFMRPDSGVEPDNDTSKEPTPEVDTKSRPTTVDPSAWSFTKAIPKPHTASTTGSDAEIGFTDIFCPDRSTSSVNAGRKQYKNGRKIDPLETIESQQDSEGPDFDTLAAKKSRELKQEQRRLQKRKSMNNMSSAPKKRKS